jgi:penicillin-binding protein 2
MAAVVNEGGGTGSKAKPEDGSFTVAGKTGTSQVGRASSETAQLDLRWELRDHALFVCYAPIDKPRYAVSVIVEHGGGGGATAAPLARDILEKVIDRDPLAKAAWPGVSPGSSVRRAAATDAKREG